ncbi:MAG: hypothetical protein ABIW03_00715 [Sphingomicrobium sp.]
MAKKASSKKTAAKTGAKRVAAKPKAKGAARKPVSKAAASPRPASGTAVDTLLKLLESPLVADLLAVGATAAMAVVTESRHGRGTDGKSGKTVKAAGKAAAAAIGRRISSEFDEIKKAAKKAKPSAKG